MAPLPSAQERALQAVGARRKTPPAPSPREIVATLRELAGASPALVALLDADAIAGERHLLSAWAHLGRSRGRGGARLRDRSAEFALYVAGDDQLPRALAKVGVGDRTERFVLVAERPLELPALLERFGLVADPSAYPRATDASTLDRLGVSPEERGTVPSSAWEGLVLERVALIDLAPPTGRAAPPKP
jgi:tRNA threonylcarbamoyladenosine modification (KEOPS) complex Cgi121 subunit